MHWFYVVSMICVHLALARSQLSFQPPNIIHDLEQGTEQIVSCLYAGGVNNRVHWMENNSVVSATHQIDLSSLFPFDHKLYCEYESGSGAKETKLLTVNIFTLTRLELFPTHTNLSLSTLLSNSTPSYLYCLGYGIPTPLLVWKEDNIIFTSISTDSIDTSAEFNTSATVVIDLKSFPPGLHHLSCYGYNGFSSDTIAFDLFVDSSSPLLITPQANSSYNNTPLYDLEENALLSLHCSIRSFSLPPDSQWVGRKPFWSLATSSGQPTDTVSHSPTLLLSNNTIGTLACVVRSLRNATILTRLVHVSFVRHTSTPPTQTSTNSANAGTSTANNTAATNYTVLISSHSRNTTILHTRHTTASADETPDAETTTRATSRTTSDQLAATTTFLPSPSTVYLSSLTIALIIAALITLLCMTLMLLFSLCCLLVCRHVAIRRLARRRRRRLSRIQYIDPMDDAYPLPSLSTGAQRDSNEYSQMSGAEGADTTRNPAIGLAQALGVRVRIYERIEDLQGAIQPEENETVPPSEQTQISSENTANTSDTSV